MAHSHLWRGPNIFVGQSVHKLWARPREMWLKWGQLCRKADPEPQEIAQSWLVMELTVGFNLNPYFQKIKKTNDIPH